MTLGCGQSWVWSRGIPWILNRELGRVAAALCWLGGTRGRPLPDPGTSPAGALLSCGSVLGPLSGTGEFLVSQKPGKPMRTVRLGLFLGQAQSPNRRAPTAVPAMWAMSRRGWSQSEQENCCQQLEWVGLSAREPFGCQELNGGGSEEELMDKKQGVTFPRGI